MSQLIEVPAGLAEEAVKGAVVFEVAQLPGVNDAGDRAPARAEEPGTTDGPEGVEAGLGKAGLNAPQ